MTYPMLTIKTLFQSNDSKSTKDVLNLILEIASKQGMRGFFKGITAKLAQTLINNTILMITYEKIQLIVRIALLGILMKVNKLSNK